MRIWAKISFSCEFGQRKVSGFDNIAKGLKVHVLFSDFYTTLVEDPKPYFHKNVIKIDEPFTIKYYKVFYLFFN